MPPTKIGSIDIELNPELLMMVSAVRAGDVVGKVGYKKILDANSTQLETLAQFVLSVKALKEEGRVE